MKKQWLSMILVLCMVLCLAPATAQAAEDETGTLRVRTEVIGLPDGVSAEGKTFTFKVGMKLPGGISYQSTPLVITIGADGRTGEGLMEVASGYQYLVVETAHDDIDDYRWDYVTYPGGGYNESKLVWVYENAVSEPIYVNNGFEELANSEINSLPLTVAGYALDADVSAVTVAKMETGVTIQSFKIKQYNAAAGSWDDLTSGTFQADTKYAIEIFLGRVAGCDSTGLTRDKVTVNGNEVSVFENPSTGDMRVLHELEVLKVVKKVERIEITTQPAKTEYMAGDKFDPKGMVVTAHYTDGTTADLTENDYMIFHGDKLTQGQTYVTIQYNDGSGNSGIKVDQKITVGAYEGPHTHTYGGPWYADAMSHWHQCTDSACPDPSGSTKDLASHTFVWKVDKAATETQTGLKHEECTVCKKVLETATIPATGSSHTNSYGVYVGMTYTAGNLIYQITSIDTATVGQSKVIGVVAAKKNKIKKVTIPDRADCKGYRLNVTTIGNNAFAGCKALEKLTIGNKVTVIGKNAFKNCSKLETVVIGKAVKTISSKAFIGDNKIKKITFKGDKLKTVKKNAFSKKAKKNIKSKKTKLKGNKKAIKLFKKKLKIK